MRIDSTSLDSALATATLELRDLARIAELQNAAEIELGEPLEAPDPVVVDESARKPREACASSRVAAASPC